jgi:hypothetical protein
VDRIWPSGNAVTPHPALLRHPGLCVWEARRSDLPHVRRRPSDYVREHVRFTTQPIEEVDAPKFRDYLEMMDLGAT